MSKVSLTAEMAEAGLNKEKMHRTLRRIETKHKNKQRKEAAKGYRGYMVINSRPIYKAYMKEIPEKTVPIYENIEQSINYIDVDGNISCRTITIRKKVGEEVIPAKTVRRTRYIGMEDLEEPYVQRLKTKSKKGLKRIANKKIRKSDEVFSGRTYRKETDIAWNW